MRQEIGLDDYARAQAAQRASSATALPDGPSLDDDGDWASDDVALGARSEIGNTEIGADPVALAVKKTLEKARDNRQPAPRMKAVPAEEPEEEDELSDWLTSVFIGAAKPASPDPFPLTAKLLLRFGGGQGEPCYVRVDTEASYAAFREDNSPELAELRERVDTLTANLQDHIDDPEAHGALLDEVEDVEMLGADVNTAELAKKIEMWLPKWAEGNVHAWREGDMVCASIRLPGSDGEVRVCSTMKLAQQGIDEMARHAAEAGADGPDIIGVLPAMGCVLGAGTLVKQMAAAAPAILRRPEARGTEPFVVRIEPKTQPAISALVALAHLCRRGNKQACDEWRRLGEAAKQGGAAPIAQAMTEAVQLLRKVSG